ncbi:unnamed protein product [Orchesella dallaii]|uniref:Uncharacterized protein n=1 Tax=Orchesella dallaii TaxID=48710 RepID=A0ABP1Q633_9HEXA
MVSNFNKITISSCFVLQNPPLSLTKSQPIVSTGISSVVGGGVGRFSARASIRSWGRSNLNGSSMMEIKESGIIPFLQQALAIRSTSQIGNTVWY